MKTLYSRFALLATFIIVLASCKKEGEKDIIQDGSFNKGMFSASSSNLVLTKNAENDTAVIFNWSPADYGANIAVDYTLQIDSISDTSGTNAWANAKNFDIGNNAFHYGFITKSINDVLTAMALPAGVASNVAVRIKSSVPQYNGSPSRVPATYSNTLLIAVTPYALSLYIPGAYQGWDPSTAPLLNPILGKPGLYEAYEYITGSGVQYFKYTSAPDWNHTNYGDGGGGTLSTDGNAAGLSVPDSGYYELTANFNNNTWTATKTVWGIIGDATPGGWNASTPMMYDPVNQVWTITCIMKAGGSFKFRANNEWVIDFGIDANGNLMYADNPFFGYTANLNDLTVPSDGTYTITLDLHVSAKYSYSIVKQ